ncbi:MAG: hypothetical protein ACXADL_16315 [Candidatus Thorarchaeota archaeon]|jgi:hypothetical protein
MAIITDPDNLDRFQVLVDYENEFISIRAVDTANPTVAPKADGIQVSGGAILTDSAQNFSTSGVSTSDTLVIVEGPNINHWPILSNTATTITVDTGTLGPFNGNYTGQYAVYPATGGQVTDGATLQAIYSFLKEEWKTQASSGDAGALTDLIQFIFPLESITREQFEIGGPTHSNWDWKDDTTRNLIRTAGWNQVSSAGTTEAKYAGVVTLGTLDTDTQVYYQQTNSTSGTPTDPVNFVLLGAVNQAILFDDSAGDNTLGDKSTFLKLFARKKGKSFVTSQISDIGVTDLENIVNRFPLAHIADPAIIQTDGTLAGTGVWQTAPVLLSASDGSTSSQAGQTQEQSFTFTIGAGDFSSSGVIPGDVLATGSTDGSSSDALFEILGVGTTTLTCLQEPSVDIATLTNVDFNIRHKVRVGLNADGVLTTTGSPHTTGSLVSAGVNFTTSGVIAGDMVAVLDASDNSVQGVYKVLSIVDDTQLSIDTTDQAWDGGPYSSTSYEIYQKGMYLQYKNEVTAVSQGNLVFGANTVQQVGATWSNSGYVVGGTVSIANAEDSANNQQLRITDITTDTITVDGTYTVNADDDTAQMSGINGFIRTPAGGTISTYNWRLFGNGGTLAECFQWIQKQLRRGAYGTLNDSDRRRITDIDNASGVFRGDVTDLLMSFTSPNGTALNMFIDDLASADANNVTFEDLLGISRTNAFIVALTINVNANLIDDTSSKLTVFFTNDDAGDNTGRDYDTPDAIIVQKQDGTDMVSTDIAGDKNASDNIVYSYDYDNNVQRGAASAGKDAPITVVAIGTSGAQWVRTTSTIEEQNVVNVSLVANLERNYSNPS